MNATRLRIVVVDDSRPVRQRIVRSLLDCGPVDCVGEAESVLEAIAAVERHAPDVLVLDLHLSGGTGLDVMRALKTVAARPRVVVLTSFANDQYRAACERAGAEQVFDKILEFDQMVALIRTWASEACPPQDTPRAARVPCGR